MQTNKFTNTNPNDYFFLMTPVLKRNLKFNKFFASKIIYEDLCDFHEFIRHNLKCTKKSAYMRT